MAYDRGERSTAAIAGHPIHPMLIPLPIGLLTAAFASDIGFWLTGDRFWARASRWLIGGGVATGGTAALFGLTDFLTLRRPRQHAEGWIHGMGNVAVLALSTASLQLRLADPVRSVVPWGLAISGLSAMVLTVTGWLGGELSYRHKIGVIEDEQGSDQGW